MSLSDFDYMLRLRLPNWGKWSRQNSDRPNPNAITSTIYEMGMSAGTSVMVSWLCSRCAREEVEPGKCKDCGLMLRRVEERIPDDLPPPRPDERDAWWLTWLIGSDDLRGIPGKIAAEHRHVLAGYFYKGRGSYVHRVPSAIRALIDAEEAQWTK